jgi:hypothetical protein
MLICVEIGVKLLKEVIMRLFRYFIPCLEGLIVLKNGFGSGLHLRVKVYKI